MPSTNTRVACLLSLVANGLGQSVMLWNGVQSTQFFAGISATCDSALNTTLNCPSSIQLLVSGIQFVRKYGHRRL